MKTSDFYYDLPPELIAQTPLEKRDESRLLCLDKATGEWSHHHFYELPDFLRPGLPDFEQFPRSAGASAGTPFARRWSLRGAAAAGQGR